MRFVMLTLGLMAASAAMAQTSPPRPMLSDACRIETMKICPPTGDRGAMRQCIMANRDKFSDGCKKEFADIRARMQQMRMSHNGGDAGTPPENGTAPQ